MMQILQPPNWPRPKGFSNGIATRGTLVFIAGQIGWDEAGQLASSDFSDQVRQALHNVLAVLATSGGKPEHIMRMTWYITSKREYLAAYKRIGEVYRGLMGRHYPVMTAVEVSALVEDGAKVEIEATAVIPD
jgi:enamine deaminase RidA (YjgF/YER057c/UK114 family)